VTPLFHGNAWGAVVTALYAGGTAAFPKTFSASQFWPLVHETRATVLYTLGTVLAAGAAVIAALFAASTWQQVLGWRQGEPFGVTDPVLGFDVGFYVFTLPVVEQARSLALALVGLAMGGAGVALVAPALFARAGRLADHNSRGAAIATLTTFGYLGFLFGPVIMGGVAEVGGLRLAFVTMTALALLLAVAGFITLRSPRSAHIAIGQELLRTGRG